jgi:hypothetical protein
MFIYQLNVSVYGEQYGYNDNYPTKEIDKYECQTGLSKASLQVPLNSVNQKLHPIAIEMMVPTKIIN